MADQIISAHPGFFVLHFSFLDRKVTPEYLREAMQALPIVAWRILEGAVLPVAIGYQQQSADGCVEAIHCPNNMINDVVNGKSWNSIHAWSLDAAAAWKEWREAHGTKETSVSSSPLGAFIGRGIGLITTQHDAV